MNGKNAKKIRREVKRYMLNRYKDVALEIIDGTLSFRYKFLWNILRKNKQAFEEVNARKIGRMEREKGHFAKVKKFFFTKKDKKKLDPVLLKGDPMFSKDKPKERTKVK